MKNIDTKNWLGILFVVIGGLLVLDNFNIFRIDFSRLIFSWHSIFIIAGIIILSKSKNSAVGVILLIIGIFGTARHFFLPYFHLSFRDIWPLIIIIVGLYIIFRKNGSAQPKEQNWQTFDNCSQNNSAFSASSSDYINDSTLFTSSSKIVTSSNFRGGKISTIIGSTNIDLTQSTLAPGENNLELSILFGSCNITVPRNWKIITNVSAVFGGFEDKRFIAFDDKASEGVLVITGSVLFSGGEIHSI